MQISIKARGFTLTEALQSHTERRVRLAIGPGGSRLSSVVVRLSDENGPKGGPDKRCSIVATLIGANDVIVEHHDVDLYVAIDRATQRLGRTVTRQIKRRLIERGEFNHV